MSFKDKHYLVSGKRVCRELVLRVAVLPGRILLDIGKPDTHFYLPCLLEGNPSYPAFLRWIVDETICLYSCSCTEKPRVSLLINFLTRSIYIVCAF